MEPRTERQRKLAFASQGHWERLPSDRQKRCRNLLAQLLREVVMAERAEAKKKDRRDDGVPCCGHVGLSSDA